MKSNAEVIRMKKKTIYKQEKRLFDFRNMRKN